MKPDKQVVLARFNWHAMATGAVLVGEVQRPTLCDKTGTVTCPMSSVAACDAASRVLHTLYNSSVAINIELMVRVVMAPDQTNLVEGFTVG